MIKILFFGDIVSHVGREGVKKILPQLRKKYSPDFIIANAENTSHGNGISDKNYQELLAAGINFFTSGNHIWKRKDSIELLEKKDSKIIRPANYPGNAPGVGYKIIPIGKKTIIVLNLQGRVFMHEHINCPFEAFDNIYKELVDIPHDALFVDFHAEATSEKNAFGQYVDGRASCVVGTHTHIQTADERILPKNTAYITDVGGCYALESVIGVSSDIIIKRFRTQLTEQFSFPDSGKCVINAVYTEIDAQKSLKIKRINTIIDV